jgi:hypothetical protein
MHNLLDKYTQFVVKYDVFQQHKCAPNPPSPTPPLPAPFTAHLFHRPLGGHSFSRAITHSKRSAYLSSPHPRGFQRACGDSCFSPAFNLQPSTSCPALRRSTSLPQSIQHLYTPELYKNKAQTFSPQPLPPCTQKYRDAVRFQGLRVCTCKPSEKKSYLQTLGGKSAFLKNEVTK